MSRIFVFVTLASLLLATGAAGTAAGDDVSPVVNAPDPDSATDVAHLSEDDVHQSTEPIRRTLRLSLTPNRPGEIGVRVALSVPDRVRSLTVRVPETATVTESRGFDRESADSWTWDGDTDAPSVRFRFPVNRSFGGFRSPEQHATLPPAASDAETTSGFSFVDTGPWAIAPVPPVGMQWSYTGAEVTVARTTVVEGSGATGGEIAYLGPGTEYTRTGVGQTFRLFVPDAASMAEEPEAVLSSLVDASGSLSVGARDRSVFFVAAPTTVDWGPAGIEYGGSDAWVRDRSRLDTPANIWLHEYVHTRLPFQTTTATRWLREGPTEYYAALLTLEQGHVDFPAFRAHLARGTNQRYDETVLADPSSWGPLANYYRGALVFGDLDRRIRLASNGTHTADDVVARMNGDADQVTQSEFLAMVTDVAGANTRAHAQRYTETTETPVPWNVSQHAAAFPGTPALQYVLGAGEYGVTGPFRNRTVSTNETLAVGETLHVSVPVRNVGDTAGSYEVTLTRDGESVAAASGVALADERTNASLTYTFDEAGTYVLTGGDTTRSFTVREPASLRVTGLEAAAEATAGERVDVTVTAVSDGDAPARGEIALSADGERVATRAVTVDTGQTVTVTVPVRFDEPGTHTLAAGGATATVEVRAPTTTSRPVSLPFPTALAGLAVALVVIARLRRRA